jgi:hypothetical protein
VKTGKKKAVQLYEFYSEKAKAGIAVDHKEHHLKLFSNLDEDGIILWIMATLGTKKGKFVDIGSNDCINSNCANLALNFNWSGVFIDSQQSLLDIGIKNYRLFRKNTLHELRFARSFVTPENINQLVSETATPDDVDLVSIDIDGNDYAIFKALTAIRPKCVVIENRIEFGKHDLVVPPGNADAGASVAAMTSLAIEKGYTLIAANKYGFNTFYLRNDLVSDLLPPLSPEALFNDPVINKDFYGHDVMKKLLNRYQTSAV